MNQRKMSEWLDTLKDLLADTTARPLVMQLFREMLEEIVPSADMLARVKEASETYNEAMAMATDSVAQARESIDTYKEATALVSSNVELCRHTSEQIRDSQARLEGLLTIEDGYGKMIATMQKTIETSTQNVRDLNDIADRLIKTLELASPGSAAKAHDKGKPS